MRHSYELTEETRKVMSRNVSGIAEEANVSTRYVHAILAGTETDFFAPFEHFYAASVRSGAPVCFWDNKLEAIRARYEKQLPLKTEVECLTEKIHANAETTSQMVDALKDGVIDAVEAEKLERAIDKERAILDLLEARMQFKRELKVAGGRR